MFLALNIKIKSGYNPGHGGERARRKTKKEISINFPKFIIGAYS
jgi:glutamate synthase domain-containing protein 2